jgi:AcrR family transcriptional regulator
MKSNRLERKKRIEAFIRNDILESAIAVLMEQGIEKFTMGRVSKSAGVAKGTVYLYHTNKQALLDAVLDCAYLPLQEQLKKIITAEAEPFWILEQCIHICLAHTEEHKFLLGQLRTVLFATMDPRISDKNSPRLAAGWLQLCKSKDFYTRSYDLRAFGFFIIAIFGGCLKNQVSAVVAYYPAITTMGRDMKTFAAGIQTPALLFAGEKDLYQNCYLIHTMRELAKAPKTVPFELVKYPKAHMVSLSNPCLSLNVLKTPPIDRQEPQHS